MHLYATLHPALKGHLDRLAGEVERPNVHVLPGSADLQLEIARGDLLITDYSSIAWDFLYLNRPVLFCQYDLEASLAHQGSHLDLRRDLFGPAAYDAAGAVALVRRYTEEGGDYPEYRERMARWRSAAFRYHDDGNCERAVLEGLDRRRGVRGTMEERDPGDVLRLRQRLRQRRERYRQDLHSEPQRLAREAAALGAQWVILFGSTVLGDPGLAGDLDPLVVWDTPLDLVARTVELYRRLQPRVAADILAYTPEEMAYMAERPMVRRALAEGRVLYEG
jgi:predicted nucleotidyltransferase